MKRPTRRFLFRVATHVYGVAHPDFIGQPLPHVITRRHLAEAQAYYQLEPWGPERDSMHAAQVSWQLANVFGKRKTKLEQHIMKFGPSHKTKPKSLSGKLKAVAIGIGATINDGSQKPTRDRGQKGNKPSAVSDESSRGQGKSTHESHKKGSVISG